MPVRETLDTQVAFNTGCDARLAGFGARACPYVGWACEAQRLAWHAGWRHVDLSWGVDARWHVRPLPRVA